MEHFVSIALTLFLVTNALGTLPSFIHLLEGKKRRLLICIRELFFALGLMVGFFYLGELFLQLLSISTTTVELAGGVILFLIAMRMIFSDNQEEVHWRKGSVMVVPIATPLLAGPSFFATITIFARSEHEDWKVLIALGIAWLFTAVVYLLGESIYRGIKDKGLLACQRLMGLLIALIAVQKMLEGVQHLIASGL